jgi:hypothetical protein
MINSYRGKAARGGVGSSEPGKLEVNLRPLLGPEKELPIAGEFADHVAWTGAHRAILDDYSLGSEAASQ